MRWVGAALLVLAGCSAGDGVEDTVAPHLGDTDSTGATTVAPATATQAGVGSGPTTSASSGTPTDGPEDDGGPTDSQSTESEDDSTGTPPDAACLNGTVDPGEDCDDGNDVNADGCNRDCRNSGELIRETSASSGFGFEDQAFGAAPESDGSVIVSGYFSDADDARDGWLRRYDANGGELWNQLLMGPGGGNDEIRGLASDGGGSVYAVGYEHTAGEGLNTWIRKLDLDGGVTWTDVHNGTSSGTDLLNTVTIDAVGDVIVAGYTVVEVEGADGFLRKYSPAGDVLWSRTYTGPSPGTDLISDVEVSPAGHIYAGGSETGPLGEERNAWLGKYDADGNLLWSRSFNGPDSLSDFIVGVATIGNDDVVVCGYEQAAAYSWHTVVRRYDALGMIVWTDNYVGATGEGAHCFGIQRDGDDNLVTVGGEIENELRGVSVRKYAPDGALLWSRRVNNEGNGGTEFGRDVAIGADDVITVVGARDGGSDARDAWVGVFTP